ncbi:Thg1 C terminal domain-containing protein [Multifurca ochricompacta]|uniref:tRNA(His) guanylyltransferase n=1 Tax=Multifurca ochricompacta TaxID=376703 RepID=A0AAD4QHU9_9AGAM|nr:Thg1 C terminal domain-containing protein [Multifurca ochricompacta]
MAGTRFAYVRKFELPDPLLPGTFILLRLDGHSFHRFSDTHGFSKPNDSRALELMDHAARSLMEEYSDIVLGFGESDEYSFLLRKTATLYNRRRSKITSTLCSLFTALYVMHWPAYFPDVPLRYAPSFDARIVLYPSVREIRDYFSWRQADTHINNLYNTAFWALVQQGGKTTKEAHETLRGTVSSQKHEILFSQFGINYNALPSQFRKGSVLVWEKTSIPYNPSNCSASQVLDGENETDANDQEGQEKGASTRITLLHCDIIGDEFWNRRPYILKG